MNQLPPPLQQVGRTQVRHRGRSLAYFAGCDYYRLASHPAVLAAVRAGLTDAGLNVAASRKTTGNHPLYEKLETALAGFFQAGSALLVANGYATNSAVAQAWAGRFSHALLDERAHASVVDAAQFLDCPVIRFQHRDPEAVAQTIKRLGPHCRPILLTDGMFAHDGSVAPLKQYLKVLPGDAWILVDDAHGAGVLGKHGRGTLEHEGVGRNRVVQTITLSKAFGVYGGAILGARKLCDEIISGSRQFVGSTPLPLPLAAGALKSLAILRTDKRLRARLAKATQFVKNRLRAAGIPVIDNSSPIIAIVPVNERSAQKLSRRLLAAGIFPPFIRYPGGPSEGYFRFALSSEHTQKQLETLAEVLVKSEGKAY